MKLSNISVFSRRLGGMGDYITINRLFAITIVLHINYLNHIYSQTLIIIDEDNESYSRIEILSTVQRNACLRKSEIPLVKNMGQKQSCALKLFKIVQTFLDQEKVDFCKYKN